MNKEVRVRFAPSPTGPLHIGGVRTALYNYLFARHNDGKFILRIEDTDQSRFVAGAEDYIRESLAWLNIMPDEGIDGFGGSGPYRQSERLGIYQEYARKLVQENRAYYAFDALEELEAMRTRFKAKGVHSPQYDHSTRVNMKNSLTLPQDEVYQMIDSGVPYVIRLLVPINHEIRFKDAIRGWVNVSTDTIDDKILIKSDGFPTYHLANVIDDHLMGITDVIRGEEWLPSAPLHVLLYQFLNWQDSMPHFAHLPLILKPEGNGKLSKRDGDKHGFPVFPIEWTDPASGKKSSGFREKGYLPEATVNFLALLGWNPGTEQEIFDMDELIRVFSLERVNKAGARYDIDKANWYNQQYIIHRIPDADLGNYLFSDLQKKGIKADETYVTQVASSFRERITFLNELFEKSQYFFIRPVSYDESVIKKKWNSEVEQFLTDYSQALKDHKGTFNALTAKEILGNVLDNLGLSMGSVMQVLRVVITGISTGIDLMLTLELLGPTEVFQRIDVALEVFNRSNN